MNTLNVVDLCVDSYCITLSITVGSPNLISKCLVGGVSFLVVRLAFSSTVKDSLVFAGKRLGIPLSLVCALTTLCHFVIPLLPVTYAGYEVMDASGELAVLIGGWAGLCSRVRATRRRMDTMDIQRTASAHNGQDMTAG